MNDCIAVVGLGLIGGSLAKALKLLENWEHHIDHFIKIIPTEYKKALERLIEEKEAEQTV